ncbi:hypothetical protein Nepgr_014833 [Nepenthes gracilis]|uniref:Uncharacterized protein n=1 Tax=Nepenthes gracilis TaxID=150966 RepID=A0AAD3SM03_NEPGR|nr:hypothetical protein Nepgr_014833 [Nepenthes gracilis]
MKASLALFEKLGLYAGGVGCLPSAFDYSHDSAGWSTSMGVAAGVGALSVIPSSWMLDGRRCCLGMMLCLRCFCYLFLGLVELSPGVLSLRLGVHPVELVVCTFEAGSLKAWARCLGLHCDLACCIVLWLVDSAGCCPAELCSDCPASARGPGWMRCEDGVGLVSLMLMLLGCFSLCFPDALLGYAGLCCFSLLGWCVCEPDAHLQGSPKEAT